MRKAITGLAIVALVAGVALVAVSLGEAPSAIAQETEDQVFHQPLDDVLNGLVDDGVITADQRDKIAAAFEERFVRFGKGYRGTPHLDTVAGVLGMEVDELAANLREGSTIADVAGSDKIDEVIAALVAEQEARLDEAVADGRLTEQEADEVRSALAEQVTAMVNGEGPIGMGPFGMEHFHGRGGFDGFGFRGGFSLGSIAEALGLTADQLHEQLASGSSVADIAKTAGVEIEVVIDAALADLDEQLDTMVANERLTQERADEFRAEATAMIESMINGDMPGFGFRFDCGERFGFHGRGMPGPHGFFGPQDGVNGTGTSA
jgi:transcriptional regulator CtsR